MDSFSKTCGHFKIVLVSDSERACSCALCFLLSFLQNAIEPFVLERLSGSNAGRVGSISSTCMQLQSQPLSGLEWQAGIKPAVRVVFCSTTGHYFLFPRSMSLLLPPPCPPLQALYASVREKPALDLETPARPTDVLVGFVHKDFKIIMCACFCPMRSEGSCTSKGRFKKHLRTCSYLNDLGLAYADLSLPDADIDEWLRLPKLAVDLHTLFVHADFINENQTWKAWVNKHMTIEATREFCSSCLQLQSRNTKLCSGAHLVKASGLISAQLSKRPGLAITTTGAALEAMLERRKGVSMASSAAIVASAFRAGVCTLPLTCSATNAKSSAKLEGLNRHEAVNLGAFAPPPPTSTAPSSAAPSASPFSALDGALTATTTTTTTSAARVVGSFVAASPGPAFVPSLLEGRPVKLHRITPPEARPVFMGVSDQTAVYVDDDGCADTVDLSLKLDALFERANVSAHDNLDLSNSTTDRPLVRFFFTYNVPMNYIHSLAEACVVPNPKLSSSILLCRSMAHLCVVLERRARMLLSHVESQRVQHLAGQNQFATNKAFVELQSPATVSQNARKLYRIVSTCVNLNFPPSINIVTTALSQLNVHDVNPNHCDVQVLSDALSQFFESVGHSQHDRVSCMLRPFVFEVRKTRGSAGAAVQASADENVDEDDVQEPGAIVGSANELDANDVAEIEDDILRDTMDWANEKEPGLPIGVASPNCILGLACALYRSTCLPEAPLPDGLSETVIKLCALFQASRRKQERRDDFEAAAAGRAEFTADLSGNLSDLLKGTMNSY